jgi:hypothetical protein
VALAGTSRHVSITGRAHPGVGGQVGRLDFVTVHEGHDPHRIATGQRHPAGIGRHDHDRLVVGVLAIGIPPGRWKAQPENGVAHGLAATSESQVAWGIESKGRLSAT